MPSERRASTSLPVSLRSAHQLTLAFVSDDDPDAAGAISTLRGEFGDLEFAVMPRSWKSLASALRLATGRVVHALVFPLGGAPDAARRSAAPRSYDLVLVSSSSMIQYALEVDPTIPMMMDFGGSDSEWWARHAARGSFPGTRFSVPRPRGYGPPRRRRLGGRFAPSWTRPRRGRIVESLVARAPMHGGSERGGRGLFCLGAPAGKLPTGALRRAVRESEVRDSGGVLPTRRAHGARPCSGGAVVVGSRDGLARDVVADLAAARVVASSGDLRMLLHDRAVVAAPQATSLDLRRSVLEPMAAGMPVVTTARVRENLGAAMGEISGWRTVPSISRSIWSSSSGSVRASGTMGTTAGSTCRALFLAGVCYQFGAEWRGR